MKENRPRSQYRFLKAATIVFGCAVAALGTLGGCGQVGSTSQAWLEATALENGSIISQGPGRTLVLGCDTVGNGVPCRWTVRMLLRSTEPLSSWSLSLLGESGEALVGVTNFNYVLTGFTTPAGGEVFGEEPDLLVGAGASSAAANGIPAGNYTLMQFELRFENPADGPDERTILGALGDAGWTAPTDPSDEVPPLIQIGDNLPAPAIGGAILPEPVIIIDLTPQSNGNNNQNGNDNDNDNDNGNDNGSPSEVCGDGVDNDGDGAVDCDDSACSNHSSCDPQINCPPNLTLECDGNGNQTAVATWLDAVSVDSQCDDLVITDDFDGLTATCGEAGTALVTWEAEDDCGKDSCSATLSIVDTTAPSLTIPADFIFVCDETGTQTELRTWLHTTTTTDVCSDAVVAFARGATTFNFSGEIIWTATDECDNDTSDSSLLTIQGDTDPPTMTLIGAASMTIECGVDAYVEPGAGVADDCDATLITPTIAGSVNSLLPGVYVLNNAAVDLCGRAAPALSRTVTVEDTLPPRVELKSVSLWPPNHEYVTLDLSDCARLVDDCEGELDIDEVGNILEVSSDEPDDGNGDGNTTDDIVIVDDNTFRARAERQGGGSGRTYSIRFEAEDSEGHRVEDTCLVEVPHDQGGTDDNGVDDDDDDSDEDDDD